jgi:hypothetical protein
LKWSSQGPSGESADAVQNRRDHRRHHWAASAKRMETACHACQCLAYVSATSDVAKQGLVWGGLTPCLLNGVIVVGCPNVWLGASPDRSIGCRFTSSTAAPSAQATVPVTSVDHTLSLEDHINLKYADNQID